MQSANLLVVVASGLIVLLLVLMPADESLQEGPDTGLKMLTDSRREVERSSGALSSGALSSGGLSSGALSSGAGVEETTMTTPDQTSFRVHIRRPAGPPVVEVAAGDPLGRVGQIACSTCHSVRKPNPDNRNASSLDEFHQGLKVDHGKLACYACHNPDDADSLRSADGTKISYRDVMTLCSQCHGPQATSFAHGAHGGMNGYWDLTRGPQTKNNCIDCHDPHAPRYPKMIVTFKPRDRFHGGEALHAEHE